MKQLNFLLLIFFTAQVYSQITFTENTVLEFYSDGAVYVDAGDIDGDGDMDIVGGGSDHYSTNFASSNFLWFENINSDQFNVHVIDDNPNTVRGIVSADLVDFDKDGDLDLVGFGRSSNSFQWYENDGKGNFTIHIIDDSEKVDNPLFTDPYEDPSYDPGADPNFDPGADPLIDQYGQPEYFLTDRTSSTVIDVDQDGDLDLVGVLGDISAWYENDGDLNFTRHITSIYYVYTISAADIDGDGDIDLFGGNFWYENDGSQNFNRSHRLVDRSIRFTNSGLKSVVDIDQDNDIDLLVHSYSDNVISWLENNGAGVFTEHIISEDRYYARRPRSMSYQDIDSDGDIDILGTSNNETSNFTWFENDGSENFTAHRVESGYSENITGLANGAENLISKDINGDGHMDIIGAAVDDDAYSLYLNDGNEKFTKIRLNKDAYQVNGASYIASGDVDGDGDNDILACSSEGNNYSWFENKGNGEFLPHLVERSNFYSRNPRGIEVGDFNRDGHLDFVGSSYWTGRYSWFENDGIGNFTRHEVIGGDRDEDLNNPLGGSLNVADIDGDGDQDILAISLGGEIGILWFENDGNGNFTKNFISENIPGSETISRLRYADFDNDGDIDLLAANQNIFWLENKGNLNFEYHFLDNLERNTSIEVADIDNNNYIDIVISFYNAGGRAMKYLNDGNKSFNKSEISRDIIKTNNIKSLADVNYDGYIDIIGAAYNESYVYINDGTGKFVESLLVGGDMHTVVMADINGDCINDIVVSKGVENDGEQNAVVWFEVDGVSLVDITITEEDGALYSQANNVQYQWIDCDNGSNPITNATDKFFRPTYSGNFAVRLTFDECIEVTPCASFDALSLSTKDNDIIEGLRIYPNPSRGKITITVDSTIDKIEIYNALGQSISTTYSESNNSKLVLNNKGFYILKIYSGTKVTEKKVIIY